MDRFACQNANKTNVVNLPQNPIWEVTRPLPKPYPFHMDDLIVIRHILGPIF